MEVCNLKWVRFVFCTPIGMRFVDGARLNEATLAKEKATPKDRFHVLLCSQCAVRTTQRKPT
jgi:hypothetical protein